MKQLIATLCCLAALAAGTLAFGQDPPAHLCKYLNYSETNGGFSINVNYGQGQSANYAEGASSVQLQTNDIPAAYNQLKYREALINARAGNALDELRRTAPPIVQCPCPQQCAPSLPIDYCGRVGTPSCQPTRAACLTGYCGRTYGTCSTGYCGTVRPTCAAPCGTTPYWCGSTNRWCASAGTYWCGSTNRWCNGTADTYWCGRTNRWCSASTGQYWCGQTNRWCATSAPTGGSCCSGANRGSDGRNPHVVFQPGDPRAVCNCADNPNRGGPCQCPDNCRTCNPRSVAGYGY